MKKIIILLVLTIAVVELSYAQTCTGGLTVTVEGSDSGDPLGSSASVSSDYNGEDITCNGSSDGTADVTITGGSGPFDIAWDNGTGNSGSADDQSSPYTITGMAVGTYTVSITDDNGCSTETSVTLAEPTLLEVSGTPDQPDCNAASGALDGSIDITATGGTGAYTYAWSNSATTEDIADLGEGTYTVTVTDVNGCTTTAEFTLTEPDAVVCTADSPTVGTGGTNILCNGGTGTINVSASGGTTPYTYTLDGGTGQAAASFSGVAAGSHTITITDANGCSSTCDVTLTEPDALLAGTCIEAQDACQVGTGEVKLTAVGGVQPYNITYTAVPAANTFDQASPQSIGTAGQTTEAEIIFTGAVGNTEYQFQVTDANGCTIP